MSNLPWDIIPNILSRLPVKSLLRFTSVSKSWLYLIRNPNFIKTHLNQAIQNNDTNLLLSDESSESKLYSIDHLTSYLEAVELDHPFEEAVPIYRGGEWSNQNSVYISNTCNGLVCIHRSNYIAIWNPCTKELKELSLPPTISHKMKSSYCCAFFGFGYDSTVDSYKVLMILQYHKASEVGKNCGTDAMIYSQGTNSWRMMESMDSYIDGEDATLVPNGTLHWQALVGTNGTLHWQALVGTYCRRIILSFDLKGEKFYELLPPENVHIVTSLGTLGGNLCFLSATTHTQADLWLMKDYGVKESWTKLFTIPQFYGCPSRLRVLCEYVKPRVKSFV